MCVRHTIEETLLVTHTERIFAPSREWKKEMGAQNQSKNNRVRERATAVIG